MRASIAHHYPGRDLRELFTGTMLPDECWDLLMALPRDSALMSALADDPELAGVAAERPPSLAEFSHETEALAGIHDLLGSLLAVVVSLGGGRAPQVRPYPRPVTAAAKARKAAARQAHQDLVRRVLPHKEAGHGV